MPSKKGRKGTRLLGTGGVLPDRAKASPTVGDPEWVEVDAKRVRVERVRGFGGYLLGLELADKLGFISLLERLMPEGWEEIPWPMMTLTLV